MKSFERPRSSDSRPEVYVGGSGESSPMHGKKLSEEHKEKISQANKGKKHSEETKEKMRGRKHSEEAKEKMRGRKHSEETKEKKRR